MPVTGAPRRRPTAGAVADGQVPATWSWLCWCLAGRCQEEQKTSGRNTLRYELRSSSAPAPVGSSDCDRWGEPRLDGPCQSIPAQPLSLQRPVWLRAQPVQVELTTARVPRGAHGHGELGWVDRPWLVGRLRRYASATHGSGVVCVRPLARRPLVPWLISSSRSARAGSVWLEVAAGRNDLSPLAPTSAA